MALVCGCMCLVVRGEGVCCGVSVQAGCTQGGGRVPATVRLVICTVARLVQLCSTDRQYWAVSVGEVGGERVLLDNLASPFLNTLSRQALLPNGEGALGNRAGEFH